MNAEQLLSSKRATEILKGAKLLQKKFDFELSPLVIKILQERYSQGKSWEVQVELIRLAGKQRIMQLLPLIRHIVDVNVEHDMVTHAAACACLRMERQNLTDVTPIISRFGHIGFSVGGGFLATIGDDHMIPTKEEQDCLLEYFSHFGEGKHPGYLDPRYGLVVSCVNWEMRDSVKQFLLCCVSSNDIRISSVLSKLNTIIG